MDDVQQVMIVACIDFDEHVEASCGIVALHDFGNLLELFEYFIEFLGVLEVEADVGAGLVAYLLGVDDELRTLDDA